MPIKDPGLLPWLAGFIVLLVVLGLTGKPVNDVLMYNQAAIADGQWWRLVTGHFVHLNHWHLLLNLGGFLLCCYFFSDVYDRHLFFLWLLVSAPIVGLVFYFVDDLAGNYAGLSGLLHGWLIIALIVGWRTHPWIHALVLALITGRLIWEQLPGYDADYLRDYIDGAVHVNAHLYGALVGLFLSFAVLLTRRLKQHKQRRPEPTA